MSISSEMLQVAPPEPMSLVLDRLTVGVLLVNRDLRVIEANAAAREILDEEDGLFVQRGVLRAAHPPETHALASALTLRGDDVSEANRILAVTRRSGARPLQVVVFPLPGNSARGVDAALFLSDPARRSEANAEFLRIVYGLTRAETRLARLLATGERLDQAARQLGITVKTARTHLRRILSKTETERQADLIRLLLQGIGQIRLCLDQPSAAESPRTIALSSAGDGLKRALP